MLRIMISGTPEENATLIKVLQKWQVDNPDIQVRLELRTDIYSEWLLDNSSK